jgi:antitoxin VapB
MKTAKLFRHGGSQAVRLPKAFRLPGSEVSVEWRGNAVVLRPVSRQKLKTLADVARYMAQINPTAEFPARGPQGEQARELNW